MAVFNIFILSFCLLVLKTVSESYSNWAVLIAGSNGYYNYRHQSDISHAYYILVKEGGFPPENVITFMYNDIANNSENPFPGQLFNEPNGINYYAGINISYVGDEVNTETFLGVLRGEEVIPGRPTLKSTSSDNVFIYYSDHGATGLVAMPTGNPLYADQLISTLEYMYNNSMYNQLVFYLEACESGSMFDGLLPDNINVFATTAANPDQSSYAWYYNDTLATYMADEYSIRWMQDTEKHENSFESLITQFNDVVDNVTMSNPQKYGDFSFDNESITDFEAYDQWEPENFVISDLLHPYFDFSIVIHFEDHKYLDIATYINENYEETGVDSRNVKLVTLFRRLGYTNSLIEEQQLLKEINEEIENRAKVDSYFRRLVSVILNTNEFKEIESFIQLYTPPRDFKCLRGAYALFNDLCQPFDDYSLKYVRTIVNLCQMFDDGLVYENMVEQCESFGEI